MLKNELEKSTAILIKKGAKKKSTYLFSKKKAETFKITVDTANYHITVSMSNIQYSDFPHDFGVFKGRLSFINNKLRSVGNTHIFEYQETVLMEGRTVLMKNLTLDHPEGSKALAATGRTREEGIGTTKPKPLHDMHTATRIEVEHRNLFRAIINDENVITGWTFLNGNRTSLSKGDTIDAYFRLRIEDSGTSIDLIPDTYFTSTETVSQYKKAELQPLESAKIEYLEKWYNRGLHHKQILPDMKMHSVFNQSQIDTNRFISDLKNFQFNCAKPNSKEFIVPALVKKEGSKVVNHNIVCRSVICGIKELFGMRGDPCFGSTLILRLKNLLVIQSENMQELQNVLLKSDVELSSEFFEIFQPHAPGQKPAVVVDIEKAVAEMDLDQLDRVTVMFFSGLRINEIVNISLPTFEDLFKTGKLPIYQSKVNKYRNVYFSDKGKETIQMVFDKTKHIVYDTDKVLFPRPESNRNNVEKLNGIVNKYLSIYGKKYHFKLTSHSFRTGYVSVALKHSTTHRVQELIGHADIRSTMKYSRFTLEPEERD